ncbi:hypothetical protein ACIREO_35600 [Streptomyces sp. NPDC102441]|uniref:hypothetical protein n=1 Tax=Streptomyces sp. NPDC102441 TaxID=3366176 RepID=UPI003802F4B6
MKAARGPRNRFHHDPTAPGREVLLYEAAAQTLMTAHVKVLVVNTGEATPSEVAAAIADAIPDSPIARSLLCPGSPPKRLLLSETSPWPTWARREASGPDDLALPSSTTCRGGRGYRAYNGDRVAYEAANAELMRRADRLVAAWDGTFFGQGRHGAGTRTVPAGAKSTGAGRRTP